jgi:hypothetical protein|tara:strand:- start:204 stop:323 length:120 start_codon:yes stop_codon:yes gene_type:complete
MGKKEPSKQLFIDEKSKILKISKKCQFVVQAHFFAIIEE